MCTRAGVSRLLDRRDIDFVLFQLLPGRASCHDEPKARERGASRRWKRATEGQGLSPSGKEGEEECKGDGDDSARVDDDREHAVAEARAVLDSAESFVAEWAHVDPLLDREPPILRPAEESEDGRPTVAVHPLTRGLYDAFCERGFGQMAELGLSFPVQCAVNFILGGAFSSNPIGFAVLTRCAADLLEAHGSDALKRQYLAAMRAGDVIGTMALSEPHAGSSLAAIRTTARKRETPLLGAELGEEWSIRGDKMWTSGAFHDVSTCLAGAARCSLRTCARAAKARPNRQARDVPHPPCRSGATRCTCYLRGSTPRRRPRARVASRSSLCQTCCPADRRTTSRRASPRPRRGRSARGTARQCVLTAQIAYASHLHSMVARALMPPRLALHRWFP